MAEEIARAPTMHTEVGLDILAMELREAVRGATGFAGAVGMLTFPHVRSSLP